MKATNIVWHGGYVKAEEFERRNQHGGCVVWFTGLSASGKSTIARELEWIMFDAGVNTFVLDGDNIRHGLNKDLGFSPEDREENIRRIGEVARLFRQAGLIVLTAFISPYRKDRDQVRSLLDDGRFIEVYVKADLETCKDRDPKGLYEKALAGKIPEFTGVSAPYEEPVKPELVLDTIALSARESAETVMRFLKSRNILPENLKTP
ncbi:MAG TPA: adenylyl-sulfate kinase [Bacteroidota bacterium]